MFLVISNVLRPDILDALLPEVANLPWRDGRVSAGRTASEVKENLQADLSGSLGAKLTSILQTSIEANEVLRAASRPKLFSNLLLSKTVAGGYYGPHVDNALMKKGSQHFRTDLSFSLSLSSSDSYEGGELIIHHEGSVQSHRPAAGELVLYPSTSLHEVREVTRGERLMCVGWIESHIRNPQHREVLFDLENLRASLRDSHTGQSAELMTLDKTISNLLRLWAET